MNEELDLETLSLLNLVCEGVVVPTDEESEEANEAQNL